jgi:hypothetical protein
MHLLLTLFLAGACDPSAGVPCGPGTEAPVVDVKEVAPEPRDSYGGRTLLVDGISLGLSFLILPVGATAFLVGGPALHLAEGRPGAAAGSLALRLGLPLAGFLIGGVSCHRSDESVGFCGGALYGAAAGALAASLIDALLIARPSLFAPRADAPSVVPSISIWTRSDGSRGPAFGLAASF